MTIVPGCSAAESVNASGSDVYVLGFEFVGTPNPALKIYKNGISSPITDGSREAYPSGMFVK